MLTQSANVLCATGNYVHVSAINLFHKTENSSHSSSTECLKCMAEKSAFDPKTFLWIDEMILYWRDCIRQYGYSL